MADEHELAILAQRGELIREALSRPPGPVRPEPGYYVSYFSRAEALEELREIEDEAAQIRRRQRRRAPAAPGRRSTGARQAAAPVQNRRNPLQFIRHVFGAAVIVSVVRGVSKSDKKPEPQPVPFRQYGGRR
jgi:hypothetical protein